MESLVLLMLPAAALIVVALGVFMFADVALRPERQWSPADVRLARDIETAVRALDVTNATAPKGAEQGCRHPQPTPRVTTLEASAIVTELRQQGPAVVNRVRDRARADGHECPLLTETGMCACSMARPLACLGKCAAGYDVDASWAHGLGDALSGALQKHLRSHHLDSEQHDLNEALVMLLDAPATTRSPRP